MDLLEQKEAAEYDEARMEEAYDELLDVINLYEKHGEPQLAAGLRRDYLPAAKEALEEARAKAEKARQLYIAEARAAEERLARRSRKW